ncbi:FAD-binding domain-containing protein [Auriscalpium vulgare]|uniref:FAD-binding domain-containing protein n=1 Tax=Auriscalpium vulgare TaxID=40419 RepID=A0ACB8RNP5_9AGAM|nr:FAD-binding domain-containing protein [Auriscalpium vulgare]
MLRLLGPPVQDTASSALCRNQPGDPGFPSADQWEGLRKCLDGRLIPVVPSAQACRELNCTQSQWQSALFQARVPGSMNNYNWEQDYYSTPPSMCLRNSATCGQGRVPLFAVNATTAGQIQAGIIFASRHNLRVSVKSSGHDYLGRSTEKNFLLLWTQYFKSITVSDAFIVNGQDHGSAVTVGSGVGLRELYRALTPYGKMVVGGTAVTVSAGGGYVQGGGHSAFSPLLGLASDNALEYQVVIANGAIVTANAHSHPDLFWALRGGGAGSWGVIISVTLRTHPTFDVTAHSATVLMSSSEQAGAVMAAHAERIFDWDSVRAGQYFFLYDLPATGIALSLWSLFLNLTGIDAHAQMAPFLGMARSLGATVANEAAVTRPFSEILELTGPDDVAGMSVILGSRLVPAAAYRDQPARIGAAYQKLLDQGAQGVLGHLVAGGRVTENAHIDSAVNPKWRTAKTHVVIVRGWNDTETPAGVERIKHELTDVHMPVLVEMTGESQSGAYSNEADAREPNFRETFYGESYGRLKKVKDVYDSQGLFIVAAGVGSEEWDADGMCSTVGHVE